VRRLAPSLTVLVLALALPAAAWAASPASTSGGDAPTGHDWTITTIFAVALGIPAVLGLLTLIDIARGKHTEHHPDH
jgi:hypothetical protein